MSRILRNAPEVEPEPGSNYTPAYRQFFDRLRRARIERGLTLSEMAELVGLPLKSAYDFENLLMPLPFEWIEAWCQVVGVPFADYLTIYFAMEEADFEAQEREAEQNTQKEAAQNARGITNTAADTTEAATPALLTSPLRAAFARFFRSFFFTPK